ncbi:IS200/IS605 family transposase [Mycolicibacterium boenickei]
MDAVPRPAVRTDAKVAFRCGYHVVWCTQYRMPVLNQAVQLRVREITSEVVEEKGAWLRRLTVRPSRVDLIVEVAPQLGIHRLVKAVKARSAGILRTEFPTLRSRIPSLWTNSYFVSTVSGEVPEQLIEQYINQQPKR